MALEGMFSPLTRPRAWLCVLGFSCTPRWEQPKGELNQLSPAPGTCVAVPGEHSASQPAPPSSAASPLAPEFSCELSLLAGLAAGHWLAQPERLVLLGWSPPPWPCTTEQPRLFGKRFSFISREVSDFWVTGYDRFGGIWPGFYGPPVREG